MKRRFTRWLLIVVLAVVFTGGLTFATLELPYLVDGFLQEEVQTPGFDSFANESGRLKTELFISHFHLRTIGYGFFIALIVMIVLGFVTSRSGLAVFGALGLMLPVFAQFAGVMFFLAGLGLLNVVWLPVLDSKIDAGAFGAIAKAPFDAVMWLLDMVGVNGYWPMVFFCIAGGLLLFFLGVLAWLSARFGDGGDVAFSSVYRLSRHPQYLGWILWTYGLFLLLMQNRYPKRSWGIDPSLAWLLSTMVIIAVAWLEELEMRRRCGDSYESYRSTAPFLFPAPALVAKIAATPCRLLFGKPRPDRVSEVLGVMAVSTLFLIGVSLLTYGGAAERIAVLFDPERQQERMESCIEDILVEKNWRVQDRMAWRLADSGAQSLPYLHELLRQTNGDVRVLAARVLVDHATPASRLELVKALEDPMVDVRRHSLAALARVGAEQDIEPIADLLDDEDSAVRSQTVKTLAALGSDLIFEPAVLLLSDPHHWNRIVGVYALGTLGSPDVVSPLSKALHDPTPEVRRETVIALFRTGSPAATNALRKATSDEDWETRLYANEAIGRMVKTSQ